ncbi:MAG: hypothetical protein V3V15_03540 [Sphingorhabdus sp.]
MKYICAKLILSAICLAAPVTPIIAQDSPRVQAEADISRTVAELRYVIGDWDVSTDFISPEGKVFTAKGRYSFAWVVPDKIVSGISETPALKQTSAILFFHRPAKKEVEMAAVGPDGHLWRMIGPENSETRTTPDTQMPDGSTMMLRFTRSNVKADSFRSTMEMSNDGGKTWRVANRQQFTRIIPEA